VADPGERDEPVRRSAEGREAAERRVSGQRNGAGVSRPGAPATGPKHHYMFEIYALDTTINVEPVADAFETRTNVFKAMQGHVLGKAVYGGLFHKPQ